MTNTNQVVQNNIKVIHYQHDGKLYQGIIFEDDKK